MATKNKRNLIVISLGTLVGVLFGTTVWADLSVIKSPDASYHIEEGKISAIPSSISEKPKSHTPEPVPLALFGGGLFIMMVSFLRKSYNAVKRTYDIVFSILGLVLLSPIWLGATLLIKLTSSRGSIFFTQTRVGKDGKHFKIYKLRTMKSGAEKTTGPIWASANDSRLIPCGKFLRKTHIDEIPQFINVLKNDMSIVGPRPERPVFVEEFKKTIPNYEKRISVKPGITGLAQVWHKYDESLADVKKKIKYDLLYIKKTCLWTDLAILFRTIRVVLAGKGDRKQYMNN